MKHGVIIKTTDELTFGQTVDIVGEPEFSNSLYRSWKMAEFYFVQPHGEKDAICVCKKEDVQFSENTYNYNANPKPMVVNPYK